MLGEARQKLYNYTYTIDCNWCAPLPCYCLSCFDSLVRRVILVNSCHHSHITSRRTTPGFSSLKICFHRKDKLIISQKHHHPRSRSLILISVLTPCDSGFLGSCLQLVAEVEEQAAAYRTKDCLIIFYFGLLIMQFQLEVIFSCKLP
ncbi:unnamed protein product [Amoebophrya sp. A120]|nr:unnamed protein product [Amoebophrya sp. A120]|eukprot:GSA120T00003798001.1